ncbi:MAG: PstS family phosphate ABC transporter substrate-binding protein [Chloroflexota bacterium]
MRKNLIVSMFILLVAVLVLSACGPEATPTAEVPVNTPVPSTETAVSTVDPLAMYIPGAVNGDIITAGSSTVFPLSERMKQRFEEEGFTGNITIDSIGSGAGFERFCVNGETDISNASRAIEGSEVESCQAIGREPIEFRVGTDAIAIVVSSANDFATDVTMDELVLIFSTAATWADVRPEWPAEPIQRFIPGTDSGTFDYFVEEVFEKDVTPILAAANLQLSEDDNVLVQGVLGSSYAIGFFGFAYYQENAGSLNVLAIDGVAPTAETAESGDYPLSRPLFIYSTAQIMQEKPQVAAFIYFYLTRVNDEIVDVGYFPASQEALEAALYAWYETLGMQP